MSKPNHTTEELQKYDQLISGGKGSLGDCFRASMATILQMNPALLPNPHEQGVWLLEWEDWLAERGLGITFQPKLWFNEGLWIASVPSINYSDDTTHAVVMRDDKLFHDPSPSKKYTEVNSDDVRLSYHIELLNINKLITAEKAALLEEVEKRLPIREGGAQMGRNYWSGHARGNNETLDKTIQVLDTMKGEN